MNIEKTLGGMVLNATFNNISAISWRSFLLVEETELQSTRRKLLICCKLVTEKLYHMMFYQVHLTIDCTGAVNPTTI
jgi:hypothetical protein